MKRDAYYDYIRAYAALLVFFTHKSFKLPGGSIGVDIFFCLSGFLITEILLHLPALSVGNLLKFIFRRWMRIYPLYLASIVAAFLLMKLTGVYNPDTLVASLPRLLSFISYPQTGFATGVFWTLQIEFWFYVIFPFLFAFAYPRGLLPYVIGIVICISWIAKFLLGQHQDFAPLNTLSYMDQLMYGAICALISKDKPSIAGLFRSRWWFWGSLAVTFCIAQFVNFNGLYDPKWWLLTSLSAMICAIAILHRVANTTEFKDNFIAWLGRISFSIYLVHAIVIDYVPTGTMIPKLDTPTCLALVIAISWLTKRFIEGPGIALSKTIARFQPRTAGLTAATFPVSVMSNNRRLSSPASGPPSAATAVPDPVPGPQ
jgi:peptidoglycan/LPS O-acetylase OafA/YrhL